jgi:Cu/Ag efflux protein CusF
MHAAPRMRENQERSPFTPALGTGTLDRMRPFLLLRLLAVWLIASTVGCRDSHVREYELRGQVVAIDPARLEITIKHEDIPRFMPGMTMPFKVKEPGLLEGRVPGDLVRATLVVEDEGAHLRTIERTGSAPLAEAPVAAGSADALLNEGDVVPDAAFVDATGTSRRLSEWRGQALAVTFIYTRCPFPDFCPLMDRQFQAAQRTLASDDALGSRARLLSVSIDPGHDQPPCAPRRCGSRPMDISHGSARGHPGLCVAVRTFGGPGGRRDRDRAQPANGGSGRRRTAGDGPAGQRVDARRSDWGTS